METRPKNIADGNLDHPSWFERHGSLIIVCLVVICAASLIAELFLHRTFFDHHAAHFELENIYFYQAGIGFVAFVGVVFIGKCLRLIVRRKEDYYD